jgi:hypothetical protein
MATLLSSEVGELVLSLRLSIVNIWRELTIHVSLVFVKARILGKRGATVQLQRRVDSAGASQFNIVRLEPEQSSSGCVSSIRHQVFSSTSVSLYLLEAHNIVILQILFFIQVVHGKSVRKGEGLIGVL